MSYLLLLFIMLFIKSHLELFLEPSRQQSHRLALLQELDEALQLLMAQQDDYQDDYQDVADLADELNKIVQMSMLISGLNEIVPTRK